MSPFLPRRTFPEIIFSKEYLLDLYKYSSNNALVSRTISTTNRILIY